MENRKPTLRYEVVRVVNAGGVSIPAFAAYVDGVRVLPIWLPKP